MKLLDWLDHRTGCRELMREALYRAHPGGRPLAIRLG